MRNNELKYKNYCSYDTNIINISSFIMNNYNKKLLFYAPNSPSKYVFQFIVSNIFIILGIQLEDYPEELDPLRRLIMPIYSCVNNNIDFDISSYINLYENNILVDIKELIQKYIENYNLIDISLLESNLLK